MSKADSLAGARESVRLARVLVEILDGHPARQETELRAAEEATPTGTGQKNEERTSGRNET